MAEKKQNPPRKKTGRRKARRRRRPPAGAAQPLGDPPHAGGGRRHRAGAGATRTRPPRSSRRRRVEGPGAHGRPEHHRTPEAHHARVAGAGRQRGHRGRHEPAPAGPRAADHARTRGRGAPAHGGGRARDPARRLRLPALARTTTTCPAPTTSTSRRRQIRRFGLRTGTSSRARSGRRRRTSATSRCCGSRRSTTRSPRSSPREPQLRGPDAALPRRAPRARDRPDEVEMRIMDLVTPDRQGPARADRGPAAHRQDDPAAEDGQRASPTNHPEVLPDRPADRRAPRGGDRHGAQHVKARGDQLDLRRAGQRATSRWPRWSSRRPSAWSSTAATW